MALVIIIGMPLLVLVLSLIWRFASGPFWLGVNVDPSYQYLMNALYLADHKVPLYFQHPGTPVQVLGEGIIKLFNLGAPEIRMVESVLSAPEFYLHAIYAALIVFYTGTLMALAYYAYRQSRDWFFAFLVQLPAFLYVTMCKEGGFLLVPANVCPETLIIGLINLYVIGLLRAFFIEDKRSACWIALGWGAVCGLLIAAKFTAISLLIIPVAVLPAFRARLVFCLTAVAAFFLATLPVWSRYPLMWDNLYQMLTHTEFRGYGGPRGFIAWDSFRSGLVATLQQQWLLMSSVVFVLGTVLYSWIVRGPLGRMHKAYYWAAWTGATIILQFLMVAKETAYHYMVPAMGLFGALWAFLYLSGRGKPWVWRTAGLVFLIISLGLCLTQTGNAYRYSSAQQALSKEVYGHNGSIICAYYRCSSLPFSLAYGDHCFGLDAYQELIWKMYPRDLAMDILQFKIINPRDAFIEDALADGQQVFLYGSTHGESFFNPMFKVKLVAQSGDEALYGVLEANDKKAFQSFYMAQMALMHGQGQAAYTLGLRSKALGLPMARDFIVQMDGMIAKVKAQ
jgi:hypothetical protein